MTIVLHALVPGDPERLRAAYDRTLVRVRPERLMHVMAPCDQGLRVTEIWTDEDELRGCMAEEIPGVLAAAGYPEIMTGEIDLEVLEAHHCSFEAVSAR